MGMLKPEIIIALSGLCMVVLICTMTGCVGFGPGIPGIGAFSNITGGSGGSGTGAGLSGGGQGEGAGSGGSGSGSGGGGGIGGGGGPGSGGGVPPTGEEIPLSGQKTTMIYTYFTVNCHYYEKSATEDHTDSIEDATVTGEIPIEMIREFNDFGMDRWGTSFAEMNLKFTYQKFCPPDSEFCKPCKTTYEGPADGSVYIERAPSGGAKDWMANFYFGGPSTYNLLCSGFDPKGTYCPPRYPLSSDTGVLRRAIPPLQDTCNPGESQDLLLMGIGAPSCGITNAPFILQDGEVITQTWKNDVNDYSYQSVDATYTFHISAR